MSAGMQVSTRADEVPVLSHKEHMSWLYLEIGTERTWEMTDDGQVVRADFSPLGKPGVREAIHEDELRAVMESV